MNAFDSSYFDLSEVDVVQIEDNPVTRMRTKAALTGIVRGFDAFPDPRSGLDAIQERAAQGRAYGGLVLDLHFPDSPMCGNDLVRELLASGHLPPTVVFSAEQGNGLYTELEHCITAASDQTFPAMVERCGDRLRDPWVYLKKNKANSATLPRAIALARFSHARADLRGIEFSGLICKPETGERDIAYENALIGLAEVQDQTASLGRELLPGTEEIALGFLPHLTWDFIEKIDTRLRKDGELSKLGLPADKTLKMLGFDWFYFAHGAHEIMEHAGKYNLRWMQKVDPRDEGDVMRLRSCGHDFQDILFGFNSATLGLSKRLPKLGIDGTTYRIAHEIIEAGAFTYEMYREASRIGHTCRELDLGMILGVVRADMPFELPEILYASRQISVKSSGRFYAALVDDYILMFREVIRNANRAGGNVWLTYETEEIGTREFPMYDKISSIGHLVVHDDGAGMPQEDIDSGRIFDLEYTSKAKGGEGLDMIRKTCERYGIGLRINNGELGLEVHFYLPDGELNLQTQGA